MELNLNSILYLFFRLAPFLIVCLFTLGSIINNELKGFVYLVGLITAIAAALVMKDVGGANNDSNKAPVCSSFTINGIVSDQTPISLVIYAFTFFYLIFPIGKYNLAIDNLAVIIFFPLLILVETYWNISNGCFPVFKSVIALVIGGGLGLAWSAIIDASKLKGLQYYNVGSNRERCTRPSNQRFVCTTFKDGQAVNYTTDTAVAAAARTATSAATAAATAVAAAATETAATARTATSAATAAAAAATETAATAVAITRRRRKKIQKIEEIIR